MEAETVGAFADYLRARGKKGPTLQLYESCARSYLSKGYELTPAHFDAWTRREAPTEPERKAVRAFLTWRGVVLPKPIKEKEKETSPARAIAQERPRSKNAGLEAFKDFLYKRSCKRTVFKTLRFVREYLATHEPTLQAFQLWAQTVGTKERTAVRKFLLFKGFKYKETLVIVSPHRRAQIERRALTLERMNEELRQLGRPFTFAEVEAVAGGSRFYARLYVEQAGLYTLPAYRAGVSCRSYVYSFDPFPADVEEYELDDPYEPDGITLEIQLIGDERTAYEEVKREKDHASACAHALEGEL